MDTTIIIQMILMSLIAVFIYTFIGFIPGTDETSVLMPITLAVILAGTPPVVILSFFIAAIVTLNLVNAIPTALVGLPGGVMSSPMMEHSLYLKEKGLSALVIRKMAVGSLIGTIISIPISLILSGILAPFGAKIKIIAPLLFFIGAIFLSLIGKNKTLSLFSIIPMAILFMGLRHLYWGIGIVPEGTNITTSFFLGITIGPLIVSLFNLLNKKNRSIVTTKDKKEISIPSNSRVSKTLNPFKILSEEEIKSSIIGALVANFLFVLSPVGLTILFGESLSNRIKDPTKKATTAITTMSALAQSTYLSGIIIPLIAIGIPLSPTAIGPGGALFNAPPVFSLENNIHHLLSKGEFVAAILIGSLIAVSITYYITNRFASSISAFVLKKIPHEAILGIFISLIFLLAYMDAGLINIFGVLLIGLTCGSLNKMGVNYGIQFMTLYAAPFIIEKIILF
ncbi:tripartite tricarboxylate transporter permease [Tissierella creatinophila]|uniref:Tripartite tricarboxylate transporter TctA family protein n=1 Tax=Tissierella creatinophila DSM 6911 TaxID=1123403 RepID=A0A1U7M8F4_TISCR|nr:tripartite tricarboxylate transporter permease [Tissierella creatinophila]OLS03614.1 tripartite tricarboxylate transporter TctA family protein [Tissierella creatinophila DSM 6911]